MSNPGNEISELLKTLAKEYPDANSDPVGDLVGDELMSDYVAKQLPNWAQKAAKKENVEVQSDAFKIEKEQLQNLARDLIVAATYDQRDDSGKRLEARTPRRDPSDVFGRPGNLGSNEGGVGGIVTVHPILPQNDGMGSIKLAKDFADKLTEQNKEQLENVLTYALRLTLRLKNAPRPQPKLAPAPRPTYTPRHKLRPSGGY